MRDLYRRLGVSKNATSDTIIRAAERCGNRTLKVDAISTLGNTVHREAYDDLHGVLNELGRLRANLGMTHAPHWQGDVANDFSVSPQRIVVRQELMTRQLEMALGRHQTRWRRRCWLALVIVIGLVAAHLAGRWMS
ncbi:hypothetical protein [Salinicola halimionae]|uniref:hypothetical protein n=1 Tax=Salinicola halimionae TaxID=1949081 RepID=UPI000DA1BD21|nr:hypothetical protein [Salinicola halimionae]